MTAFRNTEVYGSLLATACLASVGFEVHVKLFGCGDKLFQTTTICEVTAAWFVEN